MESDTLKAIPVKPARTYLQEDVNFDNWDSFSSYLEELETRDLSSVEDLKLWIYDRNELESAISEHFAWIYINMTCDTTNAEIKKRYATFTQTIQPKIKPFSNKLDQKYVDSPFIKELDSREFLIYNRKKQTHLEIFSEKNIPLYEKLDLLEQEYMEVNGGLSVWIDDKELTIQQASKLLKDSSRTVRENVYRRILDRRLQEKEKFNGIYNQMVTLRNEIASNAGFDSYVSYLFKAKERFDYSAEDCFEFHHSIQQSILPVIESIHQNRKQVLEVDSLCPWDLDVNINGTPTHTIFENQEELVAKTIRCLNKVDPYFGECIETMQEMGRLDLFSRKGKAPGGYNYPLSETGIPFIFMNAVGYASDLRVIVHEAGHAVHSFKAIHHKLMENKHTTSEMAELASMSMELLSMEYWDVFISDPEALQNAYKEQLEGILRTFTWVATIDQFQHWVYNNPKHTEQERNTAWKKIYGKFASSVVDYDGIEDAFNHKWLNQIHVFCNPLYYIEYAIAQLGAIAIWKEYKEKGQEAIEKYKYALSLGYTKTLPELYQAAGIEFNFSAPYVKELINFVKAEYDAL